MIDRNKLIKDKFQIESALIELRIAEREGTLRTVDPYKWLMALTEAVYDILDSEIRKDDKLNIRERIGENNA